MRHNKKRGCLSGGHRVSEKSPVEVGAASRKPNTTWWNRFISAYQVSGSVHHACRVASIHRCTFYRHLKLFPDFAARAKDALEDSIDSIEGALYKSAVGGNVTAQIFFLKKRRPEVYGDFAGPRGLRITAAELRLKSLAELVEIAKIYGLALTIDADNNEVICDKRLR